MSTTSQVQGNAVDSDATVNRSQRLASLAAQIRPLTAKIRELSDRDRELANQAEDYRESVAERRKQRAIELVMGDAVRQTPDHEAVALDDALETIAAARQNIDIEMKGLAAERATLRKAEQKAREQFIDEAVVAPLRDEAQALWAQLLVTHVRLAAAHRAGRGKSDTHMMLSFYGSAGEALQAIHDIRWSNYPYSLRPAWSAKAQSRFEPDAFPAYREEEARIANLLKEARNGDRK